MKLLSLYKRPFDSANVRFANVCSAQGDKIKVIAVAVLLTLNSSFFILHCEAQTAGKYEFYRYKQQYAVEIDPLGQILGRVSAQFEERLDPNFSRAYEFVYQKDLEDKHATGSYPESGISIGVIERIFLVDNAAMLGQYVGVGAGLGLVNKTVSARMTAELGYKFAFGGGIGHYFIEPRLIMDAYLVTNHDGLRILPYISLPFGYAWW
ncbi:MAG TPA: hypothetical protein VFH95_12495 [Candidatus Kapabacteria bacterium]|nr:hypothetical protein [Candidatus Kapabacteria bacterium]